MKKLLLATALLAAPFAAHAEKAQGSGPSPYAECGIGAALFPDTSWAAVTSNATWDLGSTAITSALSSPEMCNAKKVKTATLILETLEALEQDVANGGGIYSTALVETMGCSNAGAVVGNMRGSYAGAVAQPGYAAQSRVERASTLYNSAKAAAAANSCATSL